jgi:hypothetical protein
VLAQASYMNYLTELGGRSYLRIDLVSVEPQLLRVRTIGMGQFCDDEVNLNPKFIVPVAILAVNSLQQPDELGLIEMASINDLWLFV